MSTAENTISVRVYYEDTDFSGRVYHASFVRFFERGRTEWLRSCGLSHSALARTQTAFAAKRLEIEFLAPAFIDDELQIVTTVEPPKGAVLRFRQTALRSAQPLAIGVADVVAISNNKAVRPPKRVLEILRRSSVDDSVDPITEGRKP